MSNGKEVFSLAKDIWDEVSPAFGPMLVIAIMVVAMASLFTIPFFYLVNWLGPAVFGLHRVTFFQAWGLLVLSGFLFRGK